MAAAALSTQLAFDYGDMPASESKALERHAETVLRIQERQRKTTVENTLALSGELMDAHKKLSNHGNGIFERWCRERCGISPQYARRLIAVHEVFGKSSETVIRNFEPSALVKLAAETCPEEAIKEALKLAKKGEVITHKLAKEIIASHTVGDPEDSEADEDDEPDEFTGEFDSAAAIDSARSFIKTAFQQWPKEKRKLLLTQLRQLVNELDDPNLINAETLE